MDRRDLILKYVDKSQRGIEIGPWFNPVAPKRDGFDVLVLDVFDAETLKARARVDDNIAADSVALIEPVDLVGSSTHIGDLIRARGEAGAFDYVVSSHNFEHLPNPIRFLQGCAEALRPGGVLSMAIPDRRACFDYFRPVTRLSEWIQAFVEDRSRPSRAQDFDSREAFARYDDGKARAFAFLRDCAPGKVSVDLDLDAVFGDWMQREKAGDDAYHDAHCSVFTPASFELLIRDAAYLGLAPFEVIEVFDSGCEFHAHLRNIASPASARPTNYEQTRNALLRRMQDEAAETSSRFQDLRSGGPDDRERRARLEETVRALEDSVRALAADNRRQSEWIRRIRRSLTWTLASPFWRLETHGERKADRRAGRPG